MPRSVLPVIVFAQFAGTSLWFGGNAVLGGQPGYSAAALTASVQVGFIAGTLVFSLMALADRLRATLLFLGCSLMGALANLLVPFLLDQVNLVLFLRLITGFFLAGIYPVGMKIAADHFPKGLSKAMGWLVGALVLGTAFPHLLRGQLSAWLPVTLFGTLSLLAVAGGLLLYLAVPGLQFAKKSNSFQLSTGIAAIVQARSFRKPALGYLGHMWELYTFWAFVPLLLQQHRGWMALSIPVGGYAFAIIALGALACVLGGIVAARFGSQRVAFGSMAVSGACCLLLPLAIQLSFYPYLAFLLAWGFAVVADSPQLSALAAKGAPAHLKGTALSLLTCAGFALTVVSLLLIQYLAAHLALPWMALVALAPGPILGAWCLRQPID